MLADICGVGLLFFIFLWGTMNVRYPNRNLNGGKKMNRNGTRKLVITAILAALTLALGLTPIGYISIQPVEITLMCIPVIIGTLMEGLGCGLVLGGIFGLTSFLTVFLKPTVFSQAVVGASMPLAIVMIFLPRLLVPVVVWLVNRAFRKRAGSPLAVAVAAVAGSLTNTVGFLGLLYVFFVGLLPDLVAAVLAAGTALNGTVVAAGAVVVAVPFVLALHKAKTRRQE